MDSSTLPTPSAFGRKLGTVFVLLATVLLTSLFACWHVRADASAAAAAMPKPQLIVSLARSNIEESDHLPVTIEISNDSDTDLSAITLRVNSPDKLQWHVDSCSGPLVQDEIALGPIGAHVMAFRTLCLKSAATIDTGIVNLLFTADFTWKGNSKSEESFVSVEKPLTVQLLGMDTLAGVPLGIAGLVAPGLLFGIVVTACGAKWGPGVALGDKLVYSVLVSAGILAALSHFSYFSLRTGLSLEKLLLLAGIGAGAGAVTGGIDAWIRHARQETIDARTARFGDDEITALGKLVHLYDKKKIRKTTLRTKNGDLLFGSLGEQRTDLVTLIGWFEVDTTGKNAADVSSLKALFTAKKYAELFDAAKQKEFAFKLVDAIQTLRPSDGAIITTGQTVRFWKPEDVQEMVPVTGELEKGEKPPLSCA